MAGVPPYRNYAAQKATSNVSWLVGGTTTVPEQNPEYLLLRTDKTSGSAVEVYRAAVVFNATLPGWVSEGPAGSTRYGFLALHMDKPSYPGTVIFKRPPSAISAGMTCAALDALWAAGTNIDILVLDRRKWYLVGGFTQDDLDNGIMMAAGAASVGSFVFDICIGSLDADRTPVMFRHYSYDTIDGDGSVYGYKTRPDVSLLADYLDGSIPADVAVRASAIEHSEVDSAVADVTVTELLRAGAEINLRSATDPIEPGSLSAEPFGVLSVALPSDLSSSNIIDIERYRRIRGTPVTFGLDIVRGDNGTQLAELVTIRAEAGHCEQAGGALDIELTCPAQTEMDGALCKFWPVEILPTPTSPDVTWTNAIPVQVLFDLLMNACPTTRWANIYWSDWFWLILRFAGTWHYLALDATDTAAVSTLRSLWEQMARLYGLFTATDLSGNTVVWHPAVYRPSLRVHTLDPLEEYASGVKLTGLEGGQYDAVTINYLDGASAAASETYTGDRSITGVDYGRALAPDLPIDYMFNNWLRYDHARDSLARQYLQRVQAPAGKVSFDIGLRGMTWRIGDQLIISSDVLGLTATPFMITSLQASPMAAAVSVEAVHYTGWPGGHSLFQEAGPVGLWRWRNTNCWQDIVSGPTTANPSLLNRAWRTDKIGDMALIGPGTGWTTLVGTWEAAGIQIDETGAVDVHGVQTTAVTCVGVDAVPSGAAGDQIDVQIGLMASAVNFIGDAEYDWLWRWFASDGDGRGLALLLRSPKAPNPDTDDSCRLVLAHCSDCDPGIGGWGAVITASLELPYGFARPATAVAGQPGVIRCISVQWDSEDHVRVYDSQRYIGELTSSPSPALVDRFDVRTPQIDGASSFALTYLVRLTPHDTAPTVPEMLPDDGLDPYYP